MLVLFLFAVLTLVVPGCITSDSQAPGKNSPGVQPKAAVPSETTQSSGARAGQPPLIESFYGSNESRSLLKDSSKKPSSQEESGLTPEQRFQLIQRALERLPQGTFFHNIPSQMHVGQPIVIEAGVTEAVTDQLLRELQGQGTVKTRDGIRYDPVGIDITLSANESDFNVRPMVAGKRSPIIDGEPEIWRWQVTPFKRDSHYITLIATVNLQVPELGHDYKREYVIYSEPVIVQGRLDYSLQQLIAKHWQSLLVGALASSLGVFAWFLALKPKSLNPTEKTNL
jgi:hypothetical protein